MANNTLADADKLVKKAQGSMKKSLFHKPDFLDAGTQFSNAGDIYKKNEEWAKAKEAFENASNAFDQESLVGKAATCLVSSAQAAIKLNEAAEAERLLTDAKTFFLEDDKAQSAMRALQQAAEQVRHLDPQISYNLYDQELDVIENYKLEHWGKDAFIDFALLAYDMQKFPETFQAWDRAKKAFLELKNQDQAAHCIVSAIAIHLQRHDIVAAEKLFHDSMQEEFFTRTEDFSMIDFVIRGVKNRDGDILEKGQMNFIVRFLKPEIQRIIASFTAPKKPKEDEDDGASKGGSAPAVQAPPEPEEEEDWML